nr:phosphate acyltransferase [Sphingomonas sp.]
MHAAPRIAVDAMGGDSGPSAMVAGIARAHRADSTLRFLIHGDERLIQPELDKHKRLAGAAEIVHTSEFITSSEKPSQAIRRAKTTSMGMAINSVKEGKA